MFNQPACNSINEARVKFSIGVLCRPLARTPYVAGPSASASTSPRSQCLERSGIAFSAAFEMPCSRSIVPLRHGVGTSPGIGRNLAPIGVGSAGFLRGRALQQSAGRSSWNRLSSAIAEAWLSASGSTGRLAFSLGFGDLAHQSGRSPRSRAGNPPSATMATVVRHLSSAPRMAPAETFKSISSEAEVRPVLAVT